MITMTDCFMAIVNHPFVYLAGLLTGSICIGIGSILIIFLFLKEEDFK